MSGFSNTEELPCKQQAKILRVNPDDDEITKKLESHIIEANTKRADKATQEEKVANIAKDKATWENDETSPVDPASPADSWPADYR